MFTSEAVSKGHLKILITVLELFCKQDPCRNKKFKAREMSEQALTFC
jgi:hypothetical protein